MTNLLKEEINANSIFSLGVPKALEFLSLRAYMPR